MAEVAAFEALMRDTATQSRQVAESSTFKLKSPAHSSSSDALLTLQSALVMSYTNHLVALTTHRMLGGSLKEGGQGAELVRNLVRLRLQIEKTRPLEARSKPKWQRWVVAATEAERKALSGGKTNGGEAGHKNAGGEDDGHDDDDDDDMDAMSFRPNPAALQQSAPKQHSSSSKQSQQSQQPQQSSSNADGVYRPPKMAPVPYVEKAQRGRRRDDGSGSDDDDINNNDAGGQRNRRNHRAANSHLLSDLSSSLAATPYAETSSGLASSAGGNGSAGTSKRAQRLREMEDYEEANFTRLVQSKKDAKRRRRDEEDVALGGATTAGVSRGSKVGAGLEEEFGDLLRGNAARGSHKRREFDDLGQRKRVSLGGNGDEGARGNRGGRGGQRGRGGRGNRFEKAVRRGR
ncbi:unnamed protein product [Jaminaea pallidilutea]